MGLGMKEEIYTSRTWEIAQHDPAVVPILKASHIFMFSGLDPRSAYNQLGHKLLFDGILQLPFERVFFEFDIVIDDPEVSRLVIFCQDIGKYEKIENDFPRAVMMHAMIRTTNKEWSHNPRRAILLHGRQCDDVHVIRLSDQAEECSTLVNYCLTAIGLLAHNSLLTREIVIPTRVHKARHNKPALYNFRLVEVGPSLAIRTPVIGMHASPALHWRRGHYRRLRNGSIVAVSACLVGDPKNGVVEKIYHSS